MGDELKLCPFCGHKAKHWMILEDFTARIAKQKWVWMR